MNKLTIVTGFLFANLALCANGLSPKDVPSTVLGQEDLKALARTILTELRMLDACVDQWAIENNKLKGAQPTAADIVVYLKVGTRLHTALSAGRCTDALGNTITIPTVDTFPKLSRASFKRLSSVAPLEFWTPFSVE
jgi:hypothetical protein